MAAGTYSVYARTRCAPTRKNALPLFHTDSTPAYGHKCGARALDLAVSSLKSAYRGGRRVFDRYLNVRESTREKYERRIRPQTADVIMTV